MKSLKFMIISFIALLVFSGGIVLLTHDFSPVTNENQIEEQIEEDIEESDAASNCSVTFKIQTVYDGLTGCKMTFRFNKNGWSGSWNYEDGEVNASTTSATKTVYYGGNKDFELQMHATAGSGYDFLGYYIYRGRTHGYVNIWSSSSLSIDNSGNKHWGDAIYSGSSTTFADGFTIYARFARQPKLYYYDYSNNLQYLNTVNYNSQQNAPNKEGIPMGTIDSGWSFDSWVLYGSTLTSGYSGGGRTSIGQVTSDTTFYPLTNRTVSYNIYYDANGHGNAPSATSGSQTQRYNKPGGVYTTPLNYSLTTASMSNVDGYTFNGWKDGSGTSYSANTSYTFSANSNPSSSSSQGITLYAQWTANKYNIIFENNKQSDMSNTITQTLNGGNYTDTSKTMTNFVTYDASVPSAKASVKGWIFNGYYTATSGGTKIFNADGSVVANVSGYTSSSKWVRTSGVTLYAQWTKKTTSVTFSANNPTNMSGTPSQDVGSSTFYFDTEISIKPKASVTGWTFNGYYTSTSGGSQIFDANGNVKNVSGYTSSSKWANESQSITFYAHWTANKYDITFNSNKPANMTSSIKQTLGGTDYTDASKLMSKFVTYDSTINTAKASATGWKFNGYYTAATGGSQVFDANGEAKASVSGYTSASKTWVKASGITLYAHWTPSVYTVTLDKQGGSGGTDYIYEKYDTGYYTNSGATTQMTTSANPISIPTKIVVTESEAKGYTFAGYYTAASGGTQYIDEKGYLTSGAATNKFYNTTATNNKLYAHWTETWAQHTTEPSKVGDYYQIDTKEKLAWFMVKVNSGNTSYKAQQTDDINLSAHNWYPIGTSANKFSGMYDGQGYQITGLNAHGDVSGLFGYVATGTVTNVYLSGATIFGQTKAGGIVADASGNSTISQNVVYNSTISGGTTGGIVGTATSGVTIRDCIYYNDNSVTLSGVICGSGGTIADCLSKVDGTIQRHNVNEANWQTVPSGMFGDKLPKALFWIANWN